MQTGIKSMNSGPAGTQLLEIRDLKTHYDTEDGTVKAVDGVNLSIKRGGIFGLVGESGCGKSVTALSILGLVEEPGRIVGGEIIFDGISLLELSESAMRDVRGNRISMIFQEPQASFNPVLPIGKQVAEVFQIHQGMSDRKAWSEAVTLLKLVGIPNAEQRARAYPHEISGGQAQRVMIAMALALEPELLIADEPTTALDVTIQAQILDLLQDLSGRHNAAVLLITHDLGVVAEICERVAVMYAGHIVEETDVSTLFDEPLHPYTQGLIKSMPMLGHMPERLETIPGVVPKAVGQLPGCRFAERCQARREYELDICDQAQPHLQPVYPGHIVRCWLYQSHGVHRAPMEKSRG